MSKVDNSRIYYRMEDIEHVMMTGEMDYSYVPCPKCGEVTEEREGVVECNKCCSVFGVTGTNK